jgi:outer membrane protein TolC
MRLYVRSWLPSLLVSACLLSLLVVPVAAGGGGDKSAIPAMLKERMDTLQKIYDLTVKAQKAGKAPLAAVHHAKLALLNAQLEMAPSKQEYIKLRQELVKEAESWEKTVQKLVSDGKATEVDTLQAHLETLEARISLEIANQAKEPPPPGGK